ncbi:daptide-type RiPP biosynthesis dehydogenase [Arthrobacter sp. MMS18-M83]|uniref:daptide-type RiPP biosynthesis dehydogenase n=1 Tax=Arthrobacter sp. MMS18-M83 TaxID=2996261 RepID=UPI00227CC280|nr:daptide-type RiPP biosynthesis dehydogenase [Arthrobacter sp. MMS18-M83]WAH95608.1 iron-containing alcohol dehydrogenase [Arthrobacter sp. MMS18-M83]
MIADRTWKTRCVVVDGELPANYLGTLIRGRAGLVVDSALTEHRDRLLDGGLNGAPVLELDARPVSFATLAVVADFTRAHGLETVVALGGGSVLDAVKLSALFFADPCFAEFAARHAKRSGLVVIPFGTEPNERPRTILMPSTVGTGAEVSAVACLDTDVGRHLIASPHLSGDIAVLDAAHFASLPGTLVFEGLLEAFLRVAGTMIGSSRSTFDDDALSLLARIVRLGHRLQHEDSAELRLAAARLSMETHTGWSLMARNPYGAKHWYVANELAYLTGERKMTATATVIGPIWDEIENGAPAWGNPHRLSELWSVVAEIDPSLGRSAASGIRELLHQWGVQGLDDLSEQTAVKTAKSAVGRWGGVLPMLRGIDHAQIQHILLKSVKKQPVLPGPLGDQRAARERG